MTGIWRPMAGGNGSHNPAEDMALADFMLGVQVLAETALRLWL